MTGEPEEEPEEEEAPGAWSVVVPVKGGAGGKSRLEAPGVDRLALARAIALDTIAAAASCDAVAHVVVVTDDAWVPLHATDIPGLRFVPESAPDDLDEAAARASLGRLDAAIAAGMAAVGDDRPRAALLGDLPALRSGDLADALRRAAGFERTVVADAEGTGSTLVTAAPGMPFASAFGDGSFARHVALGCVPLGIPDASTLRRDVDTAAQLRAAAELGLGPRTAALLGADARGR